MQNFRTAPLPFVSQDGGGEDEAATQSISLKPQETISDLAEVLTRFTKCAIIHFLSELFHF